MKTQLKLMLLLMGASFITFMGCSKHDGITTTIKGTYTSSVPTEVGFNAFGSFYSTGGIRDTGSCEMDITVTDDSTFCVDLFTTPRGTWTMKEACSRDMMNPTGSWHITGGTGFYALLKGSGRLVMTFPPNVPAGVIVIEDYNGVAWAHP